MSPPWGHATPRAEIDRALTVYFATWSAGRINSAFCGRTRLRSFCAGRGLVDPEVTGTYQIDPTINHGPFSPEEDAIIRTEVAKIGTKWAAIANHLPGRRDNHVKNRWNVCLSGMRASRSKKR